MWVPLESTPPAIGMIRGLSPLANHITELALEGWQVTAEVVQSVASSLPEVNKLMFLSCSLDIGAWRELLILTSMTYLYLGNTPCSLIQLTSFASSVRRGMSLKLGQHSCMESWEDYNNFVNFLPALNAQREYLNLLPFRFI